MTIELIEYKCPICSHLIGKEEYLHVQTEFNKIIQDKLEEKIDEMNGKHEAKLYQTKITRTTKTRKKT